MAKHHINSRKPNLDKKSEVVDKARRDFFGSVEQFSLILQKRRKRLSYSQQELADRSGVSQSYVALLERGNCSPPIDERLTSLAVALQYSPLEQKRFFTAAALLNLNDQPLFLTVDDLAQEFKPDNPQSMVWVLGSKPIEFNYSENTLYKAVFERVKDESTRFVYWVPPSASSGFDTLRQRLEGDLTKDKISKTRVNSSIECILIPTAMSLVQCAINNPLNQELRIGRLGIQSSNGQITRAVPMSSDYVAKICSFLAPAYDAFRNRENHQVEIPQESTEVTGFFRRYLPPNQSPHK